MVMIADSYRERWEQGHERLEVAELEQFATWLIVLLGSKPTSDLAINPP